MNFCEFDKYASQSYCAIHNVTNDKNLGDITKVDENKLQPFNMICGGSPCFVAGTKILTNNGYKKIEDIKIGDMVLTHKNRYKSVVRTGGEKDKEIYSLKCQGFIETQCTDYHPFYCKKTKESNPEKIKLKDIKSGYYIGSHINNQEENIFNLDVEYYYMLGVYSTEGINSIIERINKLIKENELSLAVDHSINQLFLLLKFSIEETRAFLFGCMYDSSYDGDKIYKIKTSNKDFALILCLMIQKAYKIGCNVEEKDNYYTISFSPTLLNNQWFIENNIIWYPVESITNTNKIEDVYNIEVEDDHTYTANNIITYNCQDFSVAGKQNGSVWHCNDCNETYNPLTVHYSKRKICPNCGSSNIDKTRSSLLVEFLRVIRANKPNFGIYENVKNITGKKFKDTFKMFINELNEYGYNVYWKVLNSKNYGIPQNRERVYVIFIKKELDNGNFKFPEPFDNGIRLKDLLEDDVDEKYYISDDKTKKLLINLHNKINFPADNNINQIGNIAEFNSKRKNPEVGRIYGTDGLSPTLNTCSGGSHEPKILQVGKLNDGIMEKYGCDKSNNSPQIIEQANCITAREDRGISNHKSEGTAVIEKIGNINPSGKGMNGNVFGESGLAPTLTTNKGEGPKIAIRQATKKGYIECNVGGVADLSYPDSKTRRGRVQEDGYICPTITATETGICRIEENKYTLNGYDVPVDNDGSVKTIAAMRGRNPDNPSDRTIGVHTEQRLEVNKNNTSNCLTSVQKDNLVLDGNISSIRIRKLTPKECFRLMGFSDENFNAAQKITSNSQLYKQAGNSIVVDVLYYIYIELYKSMPYLFDDLQLSSFFSGIGAFEIALDKLYEYINKENNNENFPKPQID